ncbi:MAG: patatin [Melioribacteraceae bacterium]|nr:MAG: patatin [Melioribacteraceae bacterium]
MKAVLLFLSFSMFVFGQNNDSVRLHFKESTLPFGIKVNKVLEEPELSLVLSGGGARGLSQIGVIKALRKYDIPITNIVGTSMGSIVGGLISAGYSVTELDSIIGSSEWEKLIFSDESSRNELFLEQKVVRDKAFLTLKLDGLTPVLPTAFNSGLRVSNFLTLMALNAPIKSDYGFDKLRYNYKAVCTNLIDGTMVVLEDGPLSTAMRASSSVSLLLDPVEYKSMMLVDGGLVANLPVSVAAESGADIILAINATSPLHDEAALRYPWNIADQLVSIPMGILNRQQLEMADISISPDLGNASNNDFSKVNEYIRTGYEATLEKIDEIEALFYSRFLEKIEKPIKRYTNLRFSCDDPKLLAYFESKYAFGDTISNHDLYLDMYRVYSAGGINNLEAKIEKSGFTTNIRLVCEKKPEIRSITYSGFKVIGKERFEKDFRPLLGEPYNGKLLYEKVLDVVRFYRNAGYSLASPNKINFNDEGELSINFDEGVVGDVIISGNEKTNLPVITRDFKIEKDVPLNINDVSTALVNLRSTNLFQNLEIEVTRVGAKYDVHLMVQEKLTSLVRFGLRLDNENLTQILIDLREENLFGTATELGATISLGSRNRSYSLEHRANRIFNTYLTYKLRGYYSFQDVNVYKDVESSSDTRFKRSKNGEYRQITYGLSGALGMQVGKFGNLIAEGRYERDEVKNKTDYTGNPYTGDLTALKIGLTIDSQDRYPFPSKGFLVKSYYETAQTLLGGDFAYAKFYFDYSNFFQLNSLHNIKPRFIIGFADETLPLLQQFSLGGQKSFFGLREHEFRGRQIFLASVEYRFDVPVKLFFNSFVKFRYDLGSIWANKEEIRFKDLRHGIGGSIAFETPIGPAEFSVGRSFLVRNTLPESQIVWGPVFFYFSFGYYY